MWHVTMMVNGRKVIVTLESKTNVERLLDSAEAKGYTIVSVSYINSKGETRNVSCVDSLGVLERKCG